MTRAKALLILLALWSAIYLPGLGSTELRGEEGRRILPAVTMLESGDWVVPYVGGKPFLRKPPLMNWVIALSFKLTGIRNEWAARLPSALAVLALGVAIVIASGLKPGTALAAALMSMTTFGLLAKARFAGGEIEGVYAPLFGIAIVTWLGAWNRGASPWRLWLVPAVFLGLAALAKGPLHLLFFYGIVVAVVASSNRWRALVHPAHGAAFALMVAIFAAWAVPYFRTEAASKASKVWSDQMKNRVTENRFEWKSYASNLPRGVGDLLPWVLLVPVLARRGRSGETGERIPEDGAGRRPYQAVLVASVVMFVALLLIPGILPRYVLPLAIPLALVLAVAIEPTRFAQWPLRLGCALGVLSIGYGAIAVPLINRRDDLRPLAAQIDAALAPGTALTIYDPGYQAWIFYLRVRYDYAPFLENVPASPQAVLARGKERGKFAEKRPDLAVTDTFRDKNGAEFLLLKPR
ncbi:MAG: glycosyltransferase family 39 protein [Chthoniobacteraceae bacterium]